MPAIDTCHDQVVRALEKEGWIHERTHFRIHLDYRYVYIDLRMARGSDGQREQILLIEVKCFPQGSDTTRELYTAIGQYIIYRAMLIDVELPYALYLSVPESIYQEVFDETVMRAVKDSKINMIIVNLEAESVKQWIKW